MKISACLYLTLLAATGSVQAQPSVDAETGLVVAKGFKAVKRHCTVCHSAKLILQNKATLQGWRETIRWMQEKQGLQELEPNTENRILNYLSEHYAPVDQGRRSPLTVKTWHRLDKP